MPAITQQLRITDTADVTRSVRWIGDDGTPATLTSGRIVVRATEDEPDDTAPLIDKAAVLSESSTRATVTILKSEIQAADFESLDNPAVWEFVVVRSDGRTLSAVGGSVVWSRGVARP